MPGLFRQFIDGALVHGYRLLSDPAYRQYAYLSSKLAHLRRFTPTSVNLGTFHLAVPDTASFLSSFEEIFVKQIYRFATEDASPRILDLGANIGLSVLYFKQLYPQAIITALEADPAIYSHLVKNVHGNGFADVTLLNAAAWSCDATLAFMSDGADGGRIIRQELGGTCSVRAIDVVPLLLGEQIDLLKMDIEGAETDVLHACRNHLNGVKRIFVEYHEQVDGPRNLSLVLSLLDAAGFKVYIQSLTKRNQPFMSCGQNRGFSLQLNIHGWR